MGELGIVAVWEVDMVRRAETRAILRGDEDLSEWTDRELEYGTRKLPNGYWPPKPRTIASAVHDELVKRKLRQAVELVRVSTPRAIKLLVQILDDDEATNRDRIKAAEVILDRALGKAPELESEPEPEGLAEAFFWPHGPLLPLADGEEYLDC